MSQQISESGLLYGSMAAASQLLDISASVASNAMTITLNPCVLSFRNTTMNNGSPTSVEVKTAISITIPTGATLGTVNNIQNQVYIVAINNAGTVELAVIAPPIFGIFNESSMTSSSAISSGSTSASTLYSNSARTGVAYRVIGYVESTQTTAGTWASAPSTVQSIGGQALAGFNTLGFGQYWQVFTGSRTSGTTYYNTTGRPIVINVVMGLSAGAAVTIGGISGLGGNLATSGTNRSLNTFIVPAGSSYIYTGSISDWFELR